MILRSFLVSALAMSAFSLNVAPASAAPIGCGFSGLVCDAPVGGSGSGSGSSTAAFLGFQWSFGTNAPELTGGVRWLHSGDDDTVYGIRADATAPLTKEFLPTLRLLGVYGTQTIQGELGGGYDFARAGVIVSGGVQVPNVNIGLNVGMDGYVNPIIAINSLGKPDFGGGAATCPSGSEPYPVSGSAGDYRADIPEYFELAVYIEDQYVSNGYVCVGLTPS